MKRDPSFAKGPPFSFLRCFGGSVSSHSVMFRQRHYCIPAFSCSPGSSFNATYCIDGSLTVSHDTDLSALTSRLFTLMLSRPHPKNPYFNSFLDSSVYHTLVSRLNSFRYPASPSLTTASQGQYLLHWTACLHYDFGCQFQAISYYVLYKPGRVPNADFNMYAARFAREL